MSESVSQSVGQSVSQSVSDYGRFILMLHRAILVINIYTPREFTGIQLLRKTTALTPICSLIYDVIAAVIYVNSITNCYFHVMRCHVTNVTIVGMALTICLVST